MTGGLRISLGPGRIGMWPGFCSWQQELHQSLLSNPEGHPIVWRMMDSSPQGGWDWLLHGARSLAPGALARAAADAHALCDPSTADEAKEAAAERLAKVVSFTRGAPSAIGSGRGSLRRKLHALAHSQRLFA